MFCTGLPGLSSVTELLDQSDREFIRQIPSIVSGQAAPSALECGLTMRGEMASTAPHRTNALRPACRFERVVEHQSIELAV